jgi:putative transposase
MQLVERHVISKNDPRYAIIDAVALRALTRGRLSPSGLGIDHYMHQASRYIVDLLVKEGIGTLVIGKNDARKQKAHMGKRNNQDFVQIPHARFICMLTYKAELVGITVKITEESYTSRASFLDLDLLPVRKNSDDTKYTFSGKWRK